MRKRRARLSSCIVKSFVVPNLFHLFPQSDPFFLLPSFSASRRARNQKDPKNLTRLSRFSLFFFLSFSFFWTFFFPSESERESESFPSEEKKGETHTHTRATYINLLLQSDLTETLSH